MSGATRSRRQRPNRSPNGQESVGSSGRRIDVLHRGGNLTALSRTGVAMAHSGLTAGGSVTCSNSIPAALRRSKQAWSMVGARVVCSAGARSFGAGWEGASAGRGGGDGGDAAVDALETCSGKASSAASAQTIMASAGDRRNLFSVGVFIMDDLRSHGIYFSRRRL